LFDGVSGSVGPVWYNFVQQFDRTPVRPFPGRSALEQVDVMEARTMQAGAQAVRMSGIHGGGAPEMRASGRRLTRRGRVLLLAVLTLLLTAALVGWGAARSGLASTGTGRHGDTTVIVAEGDTVWSIAAQVAPRADRRTVVRQIIATNHLHGPHIEPGQRLVVPADTP
jgi:nucleoid-associated protein YgaU